jgi:hypothetical protein
MPFPDDTSIVEMAEKIGAPAADVGKLTGQAKKLTKGDLLALWGASDTDEAIALWQASQGASIPSPAKLKGRHQDLTLGDIASVQDLWNPRRVRAALVLRDISTVKEVLPETDPGGLVTPEAINIYCCCCPCCCATAVIEPARQVA